MNHRQLAFDWNGAAKLSFLSALRLPVEIDLREGRRVIKVSGAKVRLLVIEIDRLCGNDPDCYPSQTWLAARCSLELHDFQRVLRAAKAYGLVTSRRAWSHEHRKTLTYYSISWKTICSDKAQSEPPVLDARPFRARRSDPAASTSVPPRPPTVPPQLGTVPPRCEDRSATCGGRTPKDPSGNNYSTTTISPPRSRAIAVAEDGEEGGGGGLVALLRTIGVQRTHSAIAAIRHRGVSESELREAVATAQANRHRLRSVGGAVYHWIHTGDWPAPIDSLEVIAARRHSAVLRAAAAVAEDDPSADDALERTYGARLDGMDDASVIALVAGTFHEPGVRRSPRSLLYRDVLLERLQEQDQKGG